MPRPWTVEAGEAAAILLTPLESPVTIPLHRADSGRAACLVTWCSLCLQH